MSRLLSTRRVAVPAVAGFGVAAGLDLERGTVRRAMARVALGSALLIASLFCLGGMVLIDATLRPRVPDPKQVDAGDRDAGRAAAERLVGRWVSPTGANILFSPSGAVWLGSNDRIGSAVVAQPGDTELTVSDGSFSCTYRIAFRSVDEANWTLLKQLPGPACPSGHFSRPFAFH